ncbi:unnamed protein product [Lactuca saligna]|uniref:Uncharacterized protein n=1 Tax=Lactuca saligna TaxID=75948 RepID=A0AA35UN79_LACSI|nr:unnamed protein product [Lactuca saligna]
MARASRMHPNRDEPLVTVPTVVNRCVATGEHGGNDNINHNKCNLRASQLEADTPFFVSGETTMALLVVFNFDCGGGDLNGGGGAASEIVRVEVAAGDLR